MRSSTSRRCCASGARTFTICTFMQLDSDQMQKKSLRCSISLWGSWITGRTSSSSSCRRRSWMKLKQNRCLTATTIGWRCHDKTQVNRSSFHTRLVKCFSCWCHFFTISKPPYQQASSTRCYVASPKSLTTTSSIAWSWTRNFLKVDRRSFDLISKEICFRFSGSTVDDLAYCLRIFPTRASCYRFRSELRFCFIKHLKQESKAPTSTSWKAWKMHWKRSELFRCRSHWLLTSSSDAMMSALKCCGTHVFNKNAEVNTDNFLMTFLFTATDKLRAYLQVAIGLILNLHWLVSSVYRYWIRFRHRTKAGAAKNAFRALLEVRKAFTHFFAHLFSFDVVGEKLWVRW